VLVNSVRTTVYALRLSERLQRVTAEDLRSPAGGTGRGPSG
jgi:hypothetical protein